MTIVADFTYCISSGSPGVPPFTVVFSDSSTGSPDTWFWDFGDGETSAEQSPTHTYTGVGNPTVKLKAWLSASPVYVVPGFSNDQIRQGVGATGDLAYDNWLASGWGGAGGFRALLWESFDIAGPNVRFRARRATLSWDLSSHGSASFAAILSGQLYATFQTGNAESGLNVREFNRSVEPRAADVPFIDVTGRLGTAFSSLVDDKNDFAKLVSARPNGWQIDLGDSAPSTNLLRVRVDYATEIDSTTKQIFELSANFSATPNSGPNTLSSVFTDLTPNTISTRSWRRRVTGSGASFVEFSTDAAPTEIFDKDTP